VTYHLTRDYFAAIAANLLAGDIQARVVANAEACSVEVRLIDGSRALWSNSKGERWGYSIIPAPSALTPQGGEMIADMTDEPWDLSVDDAARMIAIFDYGSPAEFPHGQPGVSDTD
jgi:hypothetical protein